ncbi:MAG: helix-turn-helix transcriptional regulator [Vagococcus sp.]|uniref:helix-turn-helix transcriptional regulator n=1 Tax=Vagococcus sp. TaxID=1933889 RepID=UPI002FCC51DE
MLYKKIKELALKMDTSIYRIEKDCGLSNGLIGKWGNTANQKPSAEALLKVAKYLGTTVEELLNKNKEE